MSRSDRVRVVYIAGWGRSGSTLLELILDTLPGWRATGELRCLWEAGLRRNQLCGCGARFGDRRSVALLTWPFRW